MFSSRINESSLVKLHLFKMSDLCSYSGDSLVLHCTTFSTHNHTTSKMVPVLPSSARRSNKGRFCRAEAFIRNKNAANRLTASWSAIKKQENEKNVCHPEVCRGVSLCGHQVVELNVLAEALDGGCEACGAALRLSDCIKERVSGLGSLPYICCSNSECRETNIGRTNETHRRTGTPLGRPIFDVNTKLAAGLFTFTDVKNIFHIKASIQHPANFLIS